MISSFGELMFRKEFGVVCKANFRKYRGTLICFIPTPAVAADLVEFARQIHLPGKVLGLQGFKG